MIPFISPGFHEWERPYVVDAYCNIPVEVILDLSFENPNGLPNEKVLISRDIYSGKFKC